MAGTVRKYEFAGILFTIALGILLRFTYEWSGRSIVFGTFSAVNESAWERAKLLFFPFFVYGLFEYFSFAENSAGFFSAKAAGMLCGLCAVFFLFYAYTALLGQTAWILDGLVLTFGTVLAYAVSFRGLTVGWKRIRLAESNIPAVAVAFLLLLCFVIFTFFTPHAFLFHDVTTNTYGIPL